MDVTNAAVGEELMSHFLRISPGWTTPSNTKKSDSEPDYDQHTVLKEASVGRYYLYMIKYHQCGSYNGTKILVYEGEKPKEQPDPHFLEEKKSPIARFEPTERGWEMAIKFALMMTGLIK